MHSLLPWLPQHCSLSLSTSTLSFFWLLFLCPPSSVFFLNLDCLIHLHLRITHSYPLTAFLGSSSGFGTPVSIFPQQRPNQFQYLPPCGWLLFFPSGQWSPCPFKDRKLTACRTPPPLLPHWVGNKTWFVLPVRCLPMVSSLSVQVLDQMLARNMSL